MKCINWCIDLMFNYSPASNVIQYITVSNYNGSTITVVDEEYLSNNMHMWTWSKILSHIYAAEYKLILSQNVWLYNIYISIKIVDIRSAAAAARSLLLVVDHCQNVFYYSIDFKCIIWLTKCCCDVFAIYVQGLDFKFEVDECRSIGVYILLLSPFLPKNEGGKRAGIT